MGLNLRRACVRAAWAVLAASAALAAHDGWRWWQASQVNRAIAEGRLGGTDDPRAPRELRFAQAAAQAASGATEAALSRYGALHAPDALGRAARYNAANLLLRQAIELRQANQPGQALALVELAKEGYREVLRDAPDDWPARYNLERAQRLVPEPEAADEEPTEPRKSAERAATTMRGYSPGLP